MDKIKKLLREILAPKITVYKKTYTSKDFPEKEWEEVWKKQEEVFEAMNKVFKKL